MTSMEPRSDIAGYPNPVLGKMWFLTIDTFVGIPVFIAELSKR